MKWFQNFDNIPKKLQREITQNSSNMKKFYTMSTKERQDALDRIISLNSQKEIDEFLN